MMVVRVKCPFLKLRISRVQRASSCTLLRLRSRLRLGSGNTEISETVRSERVWVDPIFSLVFLLSPLTPMSFQ